MTDLILTGFMGTGKSTVGRILANRYGLSLVDTDGEIERRAGCTIAEFWARHDELAFRDLEAEVFHDLMGNGSTGRVIATGAGTLVSERNRRHIGPDRPVICLTCAMDPLLSRLKERPDSRPLLSGNGAEDRRALVERRLEERRPIYDSYQQVDTTGRTPEEVAGEIAARIDLAGVGKLTVEARRESDVLCARGLLRNVGDIFVERGFTGGVLLVTDAGVRRHGWDTPVIESLRERGIRPCQAPLPAGEEHKTLRTVETLYGAAVDGHLDRAAVVIGMGGGVIGDIAGMLAATYLRGVHLVLLPTTLLAQVDASIGGKVGVDLMGMKNLVGAFYPADVVVVDPDVLPTLPAADLADGLCEVLKIALVRSADLLDRVEELGGPSDVLDRPDIVRLAVQEKLRLVQDDPYERGDRALLNFGHTVGHALETASGFRLSHGQAISAGMVAETWLAEGEGICPAGMRERISRTLSGFGLPLRGEGLDGSAVWEVMQHDKKRRDGRLRFALPVGPGHGTVVDVPAPVAKTAVEYALGGRV